MATKERMSAAMPFLSECVLGLVTVCCAAMHIMAPSLSAQFSTLMVGGLFALILVPASLVYACWYCVDYLFPGTYIEYFVYTFCAVYGVAMLVLDKSHIRPLPVDCYRKPETWLERQSYDFWKSHFDYFPMTIEVDPKVQLPPTKQYIFGVHPHGIHCWPLNMFAFPESPFDKKFPGLVGKRLTGLAATVVFKIPVVRELFLSMGYVDASKNVAKKALAKGRSLFICTGGEAESMLTSPGKEQVVLKDRKGFVKLALSYGCSLVPVYGVGVSDLYTTYDLGTLKLRKSLQKKTGIALPFFHGWFGTPMPYRVPVRVLIGEPIDTPAVVEKGKEVDEDLLNEYHRKYIDALNKLYIQHVSGRHLDVVASSH